MRAEMANRFEQDMVRAKQVEEDLLIEADLKGNIGQLRNLFNTTVEQLKKTQLVGDYNGISAQMIEPANPPVAMLFMSATLESSIAS